MTAARSAETGRPKAGRPTREQAKVRHIALLEAALTHFLDRGFEQSTIEAIAASVGMTKRTVYALYPDKVSLFRAAVDLAIERHSLTPEAIQATDKGDIHDTLRSIALLRVRQVMTPNGLKLQRIINTESYRFPDIFTHSYQVTLTPTITFLASILERETRTGLLSVADPTKAALLFISMVVSGPVRVIVSGNTISDVELEDRINYAISVFLNGTRSR